MIRLIDALNERIGRAVAWATLAMVLLQAGAVLARYVFSSTSVFGAPVLWLQEGIVYLHGMTIMFGIAYTLLHDGHVRVDVFYRAASRRAQAWTDLAGAVAFILPLCALIWWSSAPNVAIAVRTLEGSNEIGGIPFRYALKATVMALAALLALQGLSMAAKAALVLLGAAPPTDRSARGSAAS